MNNCKTIVTLIVLGGVVLISGCNSTNNNVDAANTGPTTLKCTQDNNGKWVTIATRGNVQSTPLLIWETAEFGDNYTPEKRCHIVSEKLTTFVTDSGGRLQNLLLKTGNVNNYAVMCAVTKYNQSCNEKNIVLTFNKDNRLSQDKVLKTVDDFAKGQDTTPVYEKGNSSPLIPVNVAEKMPSKNNKGW